MLSRLQQCVTLAWILALASLTHALKFDIAAHTGSHSKYERCVRNFVGRETLVVVTATVSGDHNDGQSVSMRVSLSVSMPYARH